MEYYLRTALKFLFTTLHLIFKKPVKWLWLLLLMMMSIHLQAQIFHISHIEISGNRKTKTHIIIREMAFIAGDSLTYNELKERMEQTQKNLNNTLLFNEIKLEIFDSTSTSLSVKVLLQERFYTIPLPSGGLADRNFNVWWVQQNHNLDRINVGVTLVQKNIRGRNEIMTIMAQTGYTQQLALQYEFPFLDKNLTKGLQLYVSGYRNQESFAATVDNQQIFIRDDNHFMRQQFKAGAMFRLRPKIFIRHSLEINWVKTAIEDSLANYNPDFLLHHQTQQQYTLLRYLFECDHRDVKAYPLKGYLITFTATRYGMLLSDNVNMSEITLLTSRYTPISKNLFLYNSFKGKLSAPSEQPYNLQKAFGYANDFVRGYEYEVVDGQHYALFRNDLKWKIFQKKYPLHYSYLHTFLQTLPLQVFLKAFVDAGYVVDKYYFANNPLNNSWLIGYGVGVDFVTAYDLLLRCEISRTKTGATGFFLHFRANI